ncbi:hypothetical protein V1524DRAFT_457839 [Lipomyces starkeyi]
MPNTIQLATDSHLLAFLAIILVNAAIVTVVCALPDPLSDRAQEAKRNITLLPTAVTLEDVLRDFIPKDKVLSIDHNPAPVVVNEKVFPNFCSGTTETNGLQSPESCEMATHMQNCRNSSKTIRIRIPLNKEMSL